MLIGGATAVLIGQDLLNELTNTDYAELIGAPRRIFALASESITFINLN